MHASVCVYVLAFVSSRISGPCQLVAILTVLICSCTADGYDSLKNPILEDKIKLDRNLFFRVWGENENEISSSSSFPLFALLRRVRFVCMWLACA